MHTFKIPTFLLYYIINGTKDNLTAEEIQLADNFVTKNNIVCIIPDEEEHFSNSNDVSTAFGGCMITYCQCFFSE